MNDLLQTKLLQAIQQALAHLLRGIDTALIKVERCKNPQHGDWTSNAALVYAQAVKRSPMLLAQQCVDLLKKQQELRTFITNISAVNPGFINFQVSLTYKYQLLQNILQEKERYGQQPPQSERVLLEFVSANPTGPLHVGHGRQAALGATLANLFSTQGYQVSREFYYNDAGVQIHNLALSVQARCLGISPEDTNWPADGYRGEYINDVAQAYLSCQTVTSATESVQSTGNVHDLIALTRFAVVYLRREQDSDLRAFGVSFERYFLESSLYTDGSVQTTVDTLINSGHSFEAEGALWLKTTDFGDDKDRVMRKSDGSYTYFVPDVAYHLNKWQRGFTHAINIQGSDHFGTISRVRAGLQACDATIPKTYPQYLLHKMVKVIRDGQEVKISKRAGSYVTLRDLMQWSGSNSQGEPDWDKGRDAVRFFLASRKADSEFVFDVDLALSTSEDNPVYYVQYAHARIQSVLREWGGDVESLSAVDLTCLKEPSAMALIDQILLYPSMLMQAAKDLAAHDITYYLRELARALHAFYGHVRVLVDNTIVKLARLALLCACAQVLRNGLHLLGVRALNTM